MNAGPGPLTDVQVKSFWEEGYLLVKGVLTRDEAAHYRQIIVDMVPRDLTIPAPWSAHAGRLKPTRPQHEWIEGVSPSTYETPELLPLWFNERLYAVAAQLLESTRLRAIDGSLGITMRDTSGDSILSQPLHLDVSLPPDRDYFTFDLVETQIGGCYYLSDVEPEGGGIHVVRGGPKLVEEKCRTHPNGRSLYPDARGRGWKAIDDFPESIEVTGEAGDFALLHHLMPHAASHNRRPTPRVVQFTRFIRDDHPHTKPVPPNRFNEWQLKVMTPLGRKLLGVDSW